MLAVFFGILGSAGVHAFEAPEFSVEMLMWNAGLTWYAGGFSDAARWFCGSGCAA